METIKQIQIQKRGSMVCSFKTTGIYTDAANPNWNLFIGIKEMFQSQIYHVTEQVIIQDSLKNSLIIEIK